MQNELRRVIFGFALMSVATAVNSADKVGPSFRGLPFGSGIERLKDTEFVENVAELKCYRRSKEDLNFRKVALTEIKYCYYGNRLGLVSAGFADFPAFSSLDQSLESEYGKAEDQSDRYRNSGQPERLVLDQQWAAKTLKVRLGFSTISDKGLLQYYYLPVIDQMIADRKPGADDVKK